MHKVVWVCNSSADLFLDIQKYHMGINSPSYIQNINGRLILLKIEGSTTYMPLYATYMVNDIYGRLILPKTKAVKAQQQISAYIFWRS